MNKQIVPTLKTSESTVGDRVVCQQYGLSVGYHANTPADHILSLQRMAGNQAMESLFRSGAIQAKLEVGRPNDIYEQEADRVAEQVMRMPDKGVLQSSFSVTPLVQRDVDEDEEEVVQAKRACGEVPRVTSDMETSINSLKGGGEPLDAETQTFFESRFQRDFSGVRVHTDARAAHSAQAIKAKAFTHENDIVFGFGHYAPATEQGKSLLAHELTHVVQQKDRAILQRKVLREKEEIPQYGITINSIGIVYKEDGAYLRDEPDTTRNHLAWLPFNTRINVIKSLPGEWYFVSILETCKVGYIASSCVWTNLPEPNAKLHRIGSGEDALSIARKYYGVFAEKGRDERYYVNILVHANKGEGNSSKGIYTENEGDNWKETKTRTNYLIWIPSVEYANALVGRVPSGKLTQSEVLEEIKERSIRVAQGIRDINDGMACSINYMAEAIGKRLKERLINVLVSLALFLAGAIAVLAVSTGLGAAIGALFGGACAAPGAAIGFKVGMAILEYLGLAMLLVWVGERIKETGIAFWNFLKTAWSAKGRKNVVEMAGKEFADAIALLLAFVMEAIVVYAIQAGSNKALGLLARTRFGEKVGIRRLSDWVEKQLVSRKALTNEAAKGAEPQKVPDNVKGMKFGLPEDGYERGLYWDKRLREWLPSIFMTWIRESIPLEGWKMHVSSDPASSPEVAEVVLPLLRSMRVNHKVVDSPESLAKMKNSQIGKFITIYPRNLAHAKSIIKAVDGALAVIRAKGAVIIAERPVGDSGLVYTRYGGLTKGTVTNPSGLEVPDLKGENFKPDWIEDPFAGEIPFLPYMAPPPEHLYDLSVENGSLE